MDKVQAQQLLNEITQQIPVSKNNLLTQAGQPKAEVILKKETIEAINGIFLLLGANYGNQFNAAYPNTDRSNIVKRLWANHLNSYPANLLMAVANDIAANETFLPSLAKFKEYCDKAFNLYGLPDAHRAYMEACRAPQPKKEFPWSHIAVYYAGLTTDWFFLANSVEKKAFPLFKHNYEILCERVIKGEKLDMPVLAALPEEVGITMSVKDNKKMLKKLRQQLDL